MNNSKPTIAAIVPAYNAEGTLDVCLKALKNSTMPPSEIIVFDDGSTDGTRAVAKDLGARVMSNDGSPLGPAFGRNEGALTSRADIFVFVDADVELQKEAIERLVEPIRFESGVAATFGSYDTLPPGPKLAGQYANLRHHYIHQKGERRAASFWSGIGAVSASAFLKVGGFDERFEMPSIEDIDLGARLHREGYEIRLVPTAQGTHHKDWSIQKLWHTDVFCRALPWTKMIAANRSPRSLNANGPETRKAVVAHLVWVMAAVALYNPSVLFVIPAILLAYGVMNAEFLKVLYKRGGFTLTGVGMALHWFYHVYASAILGVAHVSHSALSMFTPQSSDFDDGELDRASDFRWNPEPVKLEETGS